MALQALSARQISRKVNCQKLYEIVSKRYSEDNHFGSTENILALQTVAEMKEKTSDISTTPSAFIASVVTQLKPIINVLMALRIKQTLKQTLARKRQIQQSDSGANLPFFPTVMTFSSPN